jgi:putative membrane protein
MVGWYRDAALILRTRDGFENILRVGRPVKHGYFVLVLLALFSLVFVLGAIAPHDRADWALENVLVGLCLVVLAASYRTLPLSKVSYALLFVFLCLHEVGAHYTYAEVPYDVWWQSLTGSTFNDMMGWERNHFDRVIHFGYGLLLAYPIREVFLRVVGVRGFWGYFLPLDLTMSTSMLFELFEWGAAEFFGGDLGVAYLGTQGDVWDAHKDMLLASVGAVVAMSVTAMINLRMQRDFAAEWAESLRVKRKAPLGEVALRRMRWRRD